MKFLMLAALLAATAAPALAQPSSSNSMSSTNGMSSSGSSSSTSTTSSTAQGGMANNPAMAKVMTTCKADFAKACPGKAGPEMQSCVRDNFSSLSEPCQGAIMEMMQSRGGG